MKRLTRAIGWTCLLASAGLLGGCAVFGFVYNKLKPPEKIPAAYELPEGKTVLVMVDDVQYMLSHVEVKKYITDTVNQRLLDEELAADVVPYHQLVQLSASRRDFYSLAVSDVGRRLGADLVIFININSFELQDIEGTGLWQGHLEASVLVKDVASGQTLWPLDRRLGMPMPPTRVRKAADSSPSTAQELAKDLSMRMGDRIAKLFYKHVKDENDQADPEDF